MPNILKWNPEQKTGHRIKEELSTLLTKKNAFAANADRRRVIDRAIIFANTKHRCEEIWGHLAADGHRVGLLTGDVAQKTSAYS